MSVCCRHLDICFHPAILWKEIGRGEPCQGNISETMTCNEQMCPVDCVMTDWTEAWLQGAISEELADFLP